MSVEILRDTFQRANSSSPGTPEYGVGGIAYTEIENAGGTVAIASNKLHFDSGVTAGAVGAVHFETGNSSHGVFMKVDALVAAYTFITPFLSVRLPAAPGFYHNGSNPAFYNGFSLGRDAAGTNGMALTAYSGPSGTSQTYNSGTISLGGSSYVGEWGLVSVKDWIEVFLDGRLLYRVQTSLNLGNTRAAAGLHNTQAVGAGGSMDLGHLRVIRAQSSHPNPGSPKMAYDRDGTVVKWSDGTGANSTLTTAQKKKLNDTINDTSSEYVMVVAGNIAHWISFLFPELRDLYDCFVEHVPSGLAFSQAQYSLDTTDGLNGTWTASPGAAGVSTVPTGSSFRTGPGATYIAGIKAVRFSFMGGVNGHSTSVRSIHIYGVPQVNSSVHRVAFWHPYLDMRLPGDYLDMDDVIRNGTIYREFRIKNNSSVYTMNDIVLDIESIEYGTVVTDDYSIKRAAESTYQPSTTIASLAPGAISEIVSVRRIVDPAATFRIDTPRIRSQITSLT